MSTGNPVISKDSWWYRFAFLMVPKARRPTRVSLCQLFWYAVIHAVLTFSAIALMSVYAFLWAEYPYQTLIMHVCALAAFAPVLVGIVLAEISIRRDKRHQQGGQSIKKPSVILAYLKARK